VFTAMQAVFENGGEPYSKTESLSLLFDSKTQLRFTNSCPSLQQTDRRCSDLHDRIPATFDPEIGGTLSQRRSGFRAMPALSSFHPKDAHKTTCS
jgi:hypothetical protein